MEALGFECRVSISTGRSRSDGQRHPVSRTGIPETTVQRYTLVDYEAKNVPWLTAEILPSPGGKWGGLRINCAKVHSRTIRAGEMSEK